MRTTDHHAGIADLLFELPEDAAFSSTSGEAFVTIPNLNQTFAVDGPLLRDWFRHRHYAITAQPLPPRHLNQLLTLLRAKAHCNPAHRPVALRSGGDAGTICIDLCNSQSQSVEITREGFHVTTIPALTFQSDRGQLPLPVPGARIPDPKPPDQQTALEKWMLHALHPTGPYPILILYGPPATGKSTLAKAIRNLLDPATAPLLPLPSRARAIEKLALRHRILVFDHVTHMSPTATDTLCRISSGTGIETEDGAEIEVARPIIITTPRIDVHDWQPRADLAARAIAIDVTTEDTTLPSQAQLYSSLFSETNLETGAAEALRESSAQADPLLRPIKILVGSKGEWTGTAFDLQNEICVTAPASCSNPRSLSARLAQLTPALNSAGIEIHHHRKHGGIRQLILRNRDPVRAAA